MKVKAIQRKAGAWAGANAGTSLVELALIAPMLATMLIGSFEFGRFAYFNILAGNAARAGVQYGAQSLGNAANNTAMQNAAYNDAPNAGKTATQWGLAATANHVCKCSDGSASANCDPKNCAAGTHQIVWVIVTTSGSLTPLFHYPGLPSSFTLGTTATMRVSQ